MHFLYFLIWNSDASESFYFYLLNMLTHAIFISISPPRKKIIHRNLLEPADL